MLSIDLDTSTLQIIEPGNEAHNGGFPASCGSNDTHKLPGLNLEIDIRQDWDGWIITKRSVLKLNLTTKRFRFETVFFLGDDCIGVKNRTDTLRTHSRLRDRVGCRR